MARDAAHHGSRSSHPSAVSEIMSSIPEPSPDSADQRARDTAATSSLVDEFLACRSEKAALDAREIRTLAAAAALVEEQRARLTSRESRKTDLPARTMVAELAAAARVSERTVQRQLNDAADLCARFARRRRRARRRADLPHPCHGDPRSRVGDRRRRRPRRVRHHRDRPRRDDDRRAGCGRSSRPSPRD